MNSLSAHVPNLSYSDTATTAANPPVALQSLALELVLAAKTAPRATLKGEIGGNPPGKLALDVHALDPLEQLGLANGLDSFRVAIDVDAQGLPVALVDALAKQDGMLLEALGPRADLKIKSDSISTKNGAVVFDFRSPGGDAHFDGRVENGALAIEKQQGFLAHFGLGPLVSKKVVGNFMPLMYDVHKPEGAAPAVLTVDLLSFPLSADLSKLEGTATIDLGEITYALLPGLDKILGNQITEKAVRVPPIAVPIKHGVVTYDRLPLPVSGRELLFHGTYSLIDQSMSLDTEIPLDLFGKQFSAELEKVREYIDPKTAVPLEIRGTWKSPHFGIGKKFLDDVLKKAGASLLEKGLEGLLHKGKKN